MRSYWDKYGKTWTAWTARIVLPSMLILTTSCKKCEAIEEGYVHFRVENKGTLPFNAVIYVQTAIAVIDSTVFNEVQSSKIGMGTLNLKRSTYQGEGTYRLVIGKQSKQLSMPFGSFNKQDDYYDTYVWEITDTEMKEVNKTRTPCE